MPVEQDVALIDAREHGAHNEGGGDRVPEQGAVPDGVPQAFLNGHRTRSEPEPAPARVSAHATPFRRRR